MAGLRVDRLESSGWSCFGLGFLLIIFGGIILIDGGFSRYGVFVVVEKPISLGIIVYGIFLMRFGYKRITSTTDFTRCAKYLKCAGCGQVYSFHEVQNLKCQKCDKPVENIEGFFERHPEFRNEDKR